MLNEEDVNSLIMIELTLMSCTFDMPPQPVLLDGVSESIKPDVVLSVMIERFLPAVPADWSATPVAAWRYW